MKGILSILFALVLVASLSLVTAAPAAAADNIDVPDDYSTIQAAINAATPGDTINVAAGTYVDQLTIDKSLTLQAGSTPIIDADGEMSAVNIEADNVTFDGFKVSNAKIGVSLKGVSGCTVTNNSFDGLSYFMGTQGVIVTDSGYPDENPSSNNTISNNDFIGAGIETGIQLGATGSNEVYGNDFSTTDWYLSWGDPAATAIDVGPTTDNPSDSNLVYDNTITSPGFQTGISVGWSTQNEIYDNPIEGYEKGIAVSQCESPSDEPNEIYNNIITGDDTDDSDTGIWIDASENQAVHDNEISGNAKGIYLRTEVSYNPYPTEVYEYSKNNVIEANDITGNDVGVYVGENQDETEGNNKVNYNNIKDNNVYGVQNDGTGTLNATYNWWGDASGPEHSGNTLDVGSQGAVVSDSVDYVPWLDATYPTGTSFAPVVNTTADPDTKFSSIEAAITAATANDTLNVYAGTYSALSNAWPITVDKAVTIQSVDGAATTIIDPGANGKGVFAITADGVTIDGFTINQGTKAQGADDPVEHTVWVNAQYSTIKNNVLLNAGGGNASIYIGGREDKEDAVMWHYNQSSPLGHVIQDNTFRNANAGEGWGIYAYELKDSLIKGNTFAGDALWDSNSVEGGPGIGIIIHQASAGTATDSPGGGSVIIEDNTAQYLKYSWLTFSPHYMIVDTAGDPYEQTEVSTVEKVIVRNNTVSDMGKTDPIHDGGVAVTFQPEKKTGGPLADNAASLTIGTDNVTIGPGNDFSAASKLVNIKGPKDLSGTYYGVLDADNIVIQNNNLTDADDYAVYNGTIDTNQPDSTKTIDATNNWWGNASGPVPDSPPVAGHNSYGDKTTDSVDYEPWLLEEVEEGVTPTTYEKTLALKDGWTLVSTDKEVTTGTAWVGTDALADTTTILAYKYTAGTGYAQVTLATQLTSVDAYYVKSDGGGGVGINYSTAAPGVVTKDLGAGWNVISCAAETDAYTLLSQLRKVQIGTQEGAGVTNLIGQGSYNQFTVSISVPLVTDTDWTAIGPENGGSPVTLNAFDGYWVYMNAAKTFGVIPD